VKTVVALVVALVVCAAMFVLPHHRRDPERSQFGAFTLFDNLREMLGALRELEAPRAVVCAVISIASLLLVFWPVALVLLVRITGGEVGPVTGPALLMGGAATSGAAGVNFLMILMSQMSIGFGGGHLNAKPTALVWVVPLIQVISGVAAVLACFSPRVLAKMLAAFA
jgi:hypothetical protein